MYRRYQNNILSNCRSMWTQTALNPKPDLSKFANKCLDLIIEAFIINPLAPLDTLTQMASSKGAFG